nr:fusion protein [Paramyxoviridae sp.]
MSGFKCAVLIIIILVGDSRSQLAFSELSKIGVLPARNYALKVRGTTSKQYMVIKFLPNLQNVTDCFQSQVENYKSMLLKVLKPVNESIKLTRSYITERTTGVRFWGAIVGGVALGVATAAQITAGIALHNSIQNAAAIHQLKESLINTNKAIEKLQTAAHQTVIAVSALQTQINTHIIPALNNLGCETAANALGLRLSQYFSIISLIFGPNLRNPSMETISIQTLSQAFNDDFESLLSGLGYTKSDFLDILESNSIKGRIIEMDLDYYFMILQIEYPEMITIKDAMVQDFNLISYNDRGTEWMAIFPRSLLIRGSFISNIDITRCTQTSKSYICNEDTSSPISPQIYHCSLGQISECARSRVVNSHVSRYALSNGVIFANCIPITCLCKTTSQSIIQDVTSTNVMMTSEQCNEVEVDGIYFTVGPRFLNRTMFSGEVKLGSPVVTDPIDISNQLADVQSSINQSKDYLAKSNEILKYVNPRIVNTSTAIYLIVLSVITIVWILLSFIWLFYLTKYVKAISSYNNMVSRDSTINSLSSLIPGS